MLGTLKRAVGRTTNDFRECRRCGTTLDRPAARCPACGSRDVARYEID
jgi:anaerobic ribonucleoside-triphosphate reductase